MNDDVMRRAAPAVYGLLLASTRTRLIVAGLKIWIVVFDVCAGASWMCDAVAGGVAVPGGRSVASVS